MLEKHVFIFLIFLQTLYLAFTNDHSLIDSYRHKPTALIKSYDEVLKKSLKSLYSEDENNCTKFDQFSESVVNFTRCAVKHARPIKLCGGCVNQYNDTVSAYNNLKQSEECKYFFVSDQVVIVDIIYKEVTDLWSKNYCENCFKSHYQEFFEMSNDLMNCVNKSESLPPNATCEKCHALYVNLTCIYSNFSNSTIDEYCYFSNSDIHACMDVVDTMNRSRKIWKDKNCCKEAPFDHISRQNLVMCVTICFSPILFYCLAKNVSIIEDIKIVRPKRKFTTFIAPEPTTSE